MASDLHTDTKMLIYYVNGERQTTHHHTMTVRTILTHAGFTPAEDYRLVRDAGNHTYAHIDEEVPLHEEEKFTALFQGPTPTSQGSLA